MARDAWREVDDCFIETRSRRKCDRTSRRRFTDADAEPGRETGECDPGGSCTSLGKKMPA